MSSPDIQIIAAERPEDILPDLKGTPIEDLLRYHNFGEPFKTYSSAELLVGMCMDNRKQLHIPDNFAFILRSGGGNLRNSEFKVSFAISIGGVKTIALIGHTQCNMVDLKGRKDQFIRGMIDNAGWKEEDALRHFDENSTKFEISDEVDFVWGEADRLASMYPTTLVAPLLYKVEDSKLYQLKKS